MKYAHTLLSFLILSFLAKAQPKPGKDSSVNCVTYWDQGEVKTYTIVHDKKSALPGATAQSFHLAYEVSVTVLEATQKDYTIKWVFHLPESLRAGRPGLKDSLPIFDGMQIIYKISDVGTFLELVNWEEVRDSYTSLMLLSLPKDQQSADPSVQLSAARSIYKSREIVESAMIREIQLFHTPYGYTFTTEPINAETTLTSPFARSPLPAIQTYQITEILPQKDQFTLVVKQSLDKDHLPAADRSSSFQIDDYSLYQFNRTTGWIRHLSFQRTAAYGNMSQSDAYTIDLKN